jgi:hypothetical protein
MGSVKGARNLASATDLTVDTYNNKKYLLRLQEIHQGASSSSSKLKQEMGKRLEGREKKTSDFYPQSDVFS